MGGGFVLHALRRHNFSGRLIPVNPRYGDIGGLPCVPSLSDIDDVVDLAVFAIPVGTLLSTLEDTPEGAIKTALVLTSGFSEVGDDGARLERELVGIARKKGIRLIGPNSVGLVNLDNGLVATISQAFDQVGMISGDVVLVSQSGAFGTALVARAQQEGLGFRYFISTGNEADLQFTDLARSLIVRSDVRVVCGYLENIRSGDAFIELASHAVALRKPLIVLKAGSSVVGSLAAKSHTGALVGSDAVAQCIFDTYHVIRARDGDHFLELLKTFERTPPAKGKRLAVVSHSGGAGVMAADAAASEHAEMPGLPDDVKRKLTEALPGYATISNPLDMTGAASLQAKLMVHCLNLMLQSDAYDAGLLCVALIWREGAALFSELEGAARSCEKPFAVSWAAPSDDIAANLRTSSIPFFADPARAAGALARKLAYDDACARVRSQTTQAVPSRRPVHRSEASTTGRQIALLERYGIPLPRQVLARTLEEAEAFRAAINCPVAVKVAASDLLHRTETGAVATDVASPEELAEAYRVVLANVAQHGSKAKIDGVLVQEMIRGLAQAFVGMKRDPTFGPIIGVGPGGTFVELFGKLVMRPAPIDHARALEMLQDSPLDALLLGFRGAPPLDRNALANLISKLSRLAIDAPDFIEIEFNPIIVLPQGDGCAAVDYKFQLS